MEHQYNSGDNEPEYLRFQENLQVDVNEKFYKTRKWYVIIEFKSLTIGEVRWYFGWKKYCFYPNVLKKEIPLEHRCLKDIAEFCVEQTREYNIGRTNKN